ncbi:MAG: universal stress protein [Bacteroidetes bacterium]|nr:universal stress protein [Bacteroidota bacterium]MDA1121248.1 universal stress protein [Bacteroidota bacterium]
MKRILVPTDFSSCAKNAADVAIKITEMVGGEIHFIHYMSIPIDWVKMELVRKKFYPDVSKEVIGARSELNQLVKMAENKGVEAKYYIAYNESTSNVITQIKEKDITLVVIGSHGASGMRELFIGSNAQKIVRLSPVPTLVVKNKVESIKKPNLIFVSDFEKESMAPFRKTLEFARLLDANIKLVYINTPMYFSDTWEIKEKMYSFSLVGGNLVSSEQIVDAHIFEEGLKKYCQSNENNIVVMATHGRTGISRVFYGSLTEKVINHMDHPVLSFKIQNLPILQFAAY